MADNTKYNFYEKKNLGKRSLAQEIIKKYLNEHKYESYEALKQVFNVTA